MKKYFLKILSILFLSGFLAASCSDKTKAQLRADFVSAAEKYRPHPLWFWNNAEVTDEKLSEQMEQMKNLCSYGGVSIVPFGSSFKPDYLSDEYFARYETMLRKAGELGMEVWLYDEYGFPSGSAGYHNGDYKCRFLEKYPQHAMKSISKCEYFFPDGNVNVVLPDEGKLMSVVAMNRETKELVDLTPKVEFGGVKCLLGVGDWLVIASVCKESGEQLVDYLDPEGVGCFTEMVHNQYYDRFKEYFGSVVKGTFFDEPTIYRSNGNVWTPDFNEKFEHRYGFSPEILYPALWYDIGEQTQAARNYLFGFRAELYASGFMKQVSDWSLNHGIRATGHQDNEERVNPAGTSGDLMLCFKYQDIPGIDKIGSIGGSERPAEDYYKLVSSSAYNWDRSMVMSETFGAMGDIDWPELYSVAIDQYCKGVNILIPHAFWYDDTNVTFPPELSHRHPKYAEKLPVFNQFLARLNVLFANEGRVVNDVAVYYPIETLQGEHYLDGPLGYYLGGVEIPDMDYVKVGKILSDTLCCDYTFLHPEVFTQRCSVEGTSLRLNNNVQWNSFRTLIFPSCKTISLTNLKRAQQFYEAGGTVIFTTQLPSKSTVYSEDVAVRQIIRTIFRNATQSLNARGGRMVFLERATSENLSQLLAGTSADVRFEGTPLRYMHKVCGGKHRYLFGNLSGEAVTTSVILADDRSMEIWNPHTGKTATVNAVGKGMFELSLEPFSAICLVEQ